MVDKATISEPGGFSKQYDCFIVDGQIQFLGDGEFKPVEYLSLLTNNDGTLQSELGPLKKWAIDPRVTSQDPRRSC